MNKFAFIFRRTSLCFCFLLVLTFGCSCNKNQSLLFTPDNEEGVNFNNYENRNIVEYKDGKFGCLNINSLFKNISVYDSSLECNVVGNMVQSFQICGDLVFFLEHGNIYKFNLTDKKTEDLVVKHEIKQFLIVNNKVYYISNKNAQLYAYDLDSKKSKTIYENVKQFFIYNNDLYAVTGDDEIFRFSGEENTPQFCYKVNSAVYPFTVMAMKDSWVIKNGTSKITVINPNTGDTRTIQLLPEEEDTSVNDKFEIICNDSEIFFSFTKTNTNGSIVTTVENEKNGTWKYDLKKEQAEKLSSKCFKNLYLTRDGILFGSLDKPQTLKGIYKYENDIISKVI